MKTDYAVVAVAHADGRYGLAWYATGAIADGAVVLRGGLAQSGAIEVVLRHFEGRLDRAQVERLKQALREADGADLIRLLEQPIADEPPHELRRSHD